MLLLFLLAGKIGTSLQYSDSPEAHLQRAIALSSSGQYCKAVNTCLEIINQKPDFFPAYHLLSEILRRDVHQRSSQKLTVKTAGTIHSLEEKAPDNPHCSFLLGMIHKYLGNYAEACTYLEKSIKLGTDFWDPYEELIPYYRSQQDIYHGIKILKNLLEQSPANSYLHQGLGFCYFWLDDYSLSLSHLKKSRDLQIRTGDREAETKCLYYLAYLYMYMNDYNLSKSTIQESITAARETGSRRDEARGLEMLSFINIDCGDYIQAIKLCNNAYAIARELNDPKSYNCPRQEPLLSAF